MKVTAEALRAKIKHLKDVQGYRKRAQHFDIGVDLNADERFELAAYEALLAGMVSEPVAVPDVGEFRIFTQAGGVKVAVKDGKTKNHLFGMGWNACRAAMLKGES